MGPFPFAKYFGEINLLADLQFMPGDKPYIDRPSVGAAAQKELLLYLGCNVLRTAHLAKTVVGVLRAMGFDFNTAGGPAHCCGIVHHQNGEVLQARTFAASSMGHFLKYGAKHVLMWCPSCNEQYDEVISKEQNVPFSYEHVTAFLARHLDRIPFVKRIDRRVALHYHTGSAQSDLDWHHASAILHAIPGVELVNIANPVELGRHCSPKNINRLGRSQWQKSIAQVLDAAQAARVDVLATIYHSCHREICHLEAQYPLAIVNYISLLGEAVGIEHADVYKTYMLRADPEAIFEEVRPYVEGHRLDAARVREVIRSTFAPGDKPKIPNPS